MLILLSNKTTRRSAIVIGAACVFCGLGLFLRTVDRYVVATLGDSSEFPYVLRLHVFWEVEAWAYIALFIVLGISLLKVARSH